jgi:hypothetical protein
MPILKIHTSKLSKVVFTQHLSKGLLFQTLNFLFLKFKIQKKEKHINSSSNIFYVHNAKTIRLKHL